MSNIRDREITRLIKYAEGLGLKVIFTPYKPYSMDLGYWSIDGTELTICKGAKQSKLSIILVLIHELGHHLEFVHTYNRAGMPGLSKALDNLEVSKDSRKLLHKWEKDSAAWWDLIYNEVGLKFPKYRLEVEKAFDIWQYKVYYLEGKFPNKKRKQKKLDNLMDKYRK